jgi:hypothetical protein
MPGTPWMMKKSPGQLETWIMILERVDFKMPYFIG